MCGVVGVSGSDSVNHLIYDALTVLQHRGQDAAGIMTWAGGKYFLRKDNGLVRDVFQKKHMLHLQGSMGIGHVRYPTAGCYAITEAQPFYVNSPYGIALAHNGNLINAEQLKSELYYASRCHINTDSDSEILLNVFAEELRRSSDLHLGSEEIFTAVSQLHRRCRGAYAAVAMIADYGLVAFRDPFGIRPLVYGYRESPKGREYMVASESAALDVLGFRLIGDISPGEALIIEHTGAIHRKVCAPNSKCYPCLFEYVYFARPDSIIDGVTVYQARLRMGEFLAEKIKRERPDIQVDVVIPIPDTSRTSALQLSYSLGVPYREGFIKNRYIGRTFIMPGQEERKKSVKHKLNAIEAEFHGKHVLLVDDSIVRGTTSRQIVQMARESGALSVHFASAAPPVRFPNVYGIDMPTAEELIAYGYDVEQIAAYIGSDSLIYQDIEDLQEAVRADSTVIDGFEASCFNGCYITDDVTPAYLGALKERRNNAMRELLSEDISKL